MRAKNSTNPLLNASEGELSIKRQFPLRGTLRSRQIEKAERGFNNK